MATIDSFHEHRLTRTDIVVLCKKYWLLVLCVFLSGTLAMWLSFPIFFTEMYQSKTDLLVKNGRENVDTPGTVQRGQVISQGVQITDINSEVQMLSSRALVEETVDKLGPDKFKSVLLPPKSILGYPKYVVKRVGRSVKAVYKNFLIFVDLKKRLSPREEAIVHVAEGIKVEPVKDSDIFVLKVNMPSPALAVEVSNALLDSYIKHRTIARRLDAGSDFFAGQLKNASEQLETAEKERQSVRSQWHVTSATEQRTLALDQLSSIQAEIAKNQAEIEKQQHERDLMQSRLKSLPDMVAKQQVDERNPSIQSIKERLTNLQMERAKTASRYLPDSEVMKKLDSEIADLEKALSQEPQTVVDSLTKEENPSKRDFTLRMEQLAVSIAGLRARNQALASEAGSLEGRLHNLSLGVDAMQAADREYDRVQQEYLTYSKRLEQARMAEALDAQRLTNVAVVAAPETPITPVSPRKMFLMGIAMAVSLVLGIAIAGIVETTEDVVHDERSVEQIDDLIYLGTVKVARRA